MNKSTRAQFCTPSRPQEVEASYRSCTDFLRENNQAIEEVEEHNGKPGKDAELRRGSAWYPGVLGICWDGWGERHLLEDLLIFGVCRCSLFNNGVFTEWEPIGGLWWI